MRIVSMNNQGTDLYDARVENFKSQDECDNAFAALIAEGFEVDEYEEMELTVSGDKDEYYSKKDFINEVRAIVKNKSRSPGNTGHTGEGHGIRHN